MFIDFHAHVLPGMDHGSRNLETSLKQLKVAEDNKVSTIVATSHFYPERHTVGKYLKRRADSLSLLHEAVDTTIRIVPAAEVKLSFDLPDLEDLEKLCIAGTNYILIEMPQPKSINWIYDALYKISSVRELNPIIAHIDRYDTEFADSLMEMGFVIQINADAILPPLKRGKWIKKIEHNQIHLLGSDVHDTAKEYMKFNKAARVLKSQVSVLMQNAERVLNNQKI